MRPAVLGLVLVGAAACELPTTTLAPRAPALVVHGVLNPYVCRQAVVVEELIVGRQDDANGGVITPESYFGGRMVTDAEVVVRSEQGDSAVGAIRYSPGGIALGIYDIDNRNCYGTDASNRIRIVPGRRYTLTVTTPGGRRVTGETTIPSPGAQVQVLGPFLYNIERDSMLVQASRAQGAARYFVSVTPTGRAAVTLPLSEPRARFRGQVEILEDFERSLVFWPALQNEVLILAADPHYAQYVASYSDPITGRGQVHGVEGGFGVFGSIAPLGGLVLEVTTIVDEPLEGAWRRVRSDSSDIDLVRLYYDDRASEVSIHGRAFFASVDQREVGRVWVEARGEATFSGSLVLPDVTGQGKPTRLIDLQLQRAGGADTLRLIERAGAVTRYVRVGPLAGR